MIDLTLKNKLPGEALLCGTHTGLNDAILTEIMAGVGYDYLWIDTEHAPVDYAQLLQMVGNAWNAGTPPLVRVTMGERNHIKHVLEMGPAGIIFPMVNTAAEAADAIQYTLYPPDGIRGFGPQRAVRYGLDSESEYLKNANKALCRFVQIERKEAVDALDEILAVPGIDAFIIGPCDLSGSIGKLNRIYDEENIALVKETVRKVEAIGGTVGISIGALEEKEQRYWMELGCRMISAGADFDFAVRGAWENSRQMRKLRDEMDGEGK